MRKLSMKNKRRRSETAAATSDNESEENGVARTATSDDENGEGGERKDARKDRKDAGEQRRSGAKRRSSRGRNSRKVLSEEKDEDTNDENDARAAQEEQENGSVDGKNKRRKKEERASTSASPGSQDKSSGEREYEVEKIVGHRTIKGRRQFLVRWKGYGEDSDTWEHEKDLNCSNLIEEFFAEETENEEMLPEKSPKAAKGKPSKTEKKPKGPKNNIKKQIDNEGKEQMEEDGKNDKEGQKEFEVEKILEVHFKKNKTREFLIRWKGYSSADDTWEPEENLNCPDLIAKFMQKVEKARTTEARELRTNPQHTKRYTLTTQEHGRRLSRRNMDKQRATYYECAD